MQNEVKERTTWRLDEGEHFVFNGEVWKDKPLPIKIWCSRCQGVSEVVEVNLTWLDTPLVITETCLSCKRRIATKVEFKAPVTTVPVSFTKGLEKTGRNRLFHKFVELAALASYQAIRPSMIPRVFNPLPDSIQAGEEITCDRSSLPLRKEVAIECDCGGWTEPLVVLRNYDAYLDEKKRLGPDFMSRIGYFRYAFVHRRLYLFGFCGECRKRVEASIKLN